MIDITPGEMFTARGVIQFIAKVAVFGVKQEMDEYSENRKQINGIIKSWARGEIFEWASFHELRALLEKAPKSPECTMESCFEDPFRGVATRDRRRLLSAELRRTNHS